MRVFRKTRSLLAIPIVFLACPLAAQETGAGAMGRAERARVVEEVAAAVERTYVFPEVGARMAAEVRARLAAGAYDAAAAPDSLAEALTRSLRQVGRDEHVRVRYAPAAPAETPDTARRRRAREAYLRQARDENFGFHQVRMLPGGVALLELRAFYAPSVAGDAAAAAMQLVSRADALVIDLRDNGGGHEEMIPLLISYLVDVRTELTGIQWRGEARALQSWTLPYVPGARLGSRPPVYVLVGKETFSAAEALAYDLQALKRATVVGERTRGGANPGDFVPLSGGFSVFIPTGRAVSPVTGGNWEGTGVAPDLAVPEAQALDAALRAAWTRLAGETADPERRALYRRLLEEPGA